MLAMAAQRRWVAIELRVHSNEPSVVDLDSDVHRTERALVGLRDRAHHLVGTSRGGHQALTYWITTELDALLSYVRDAVPEAGVASVTALVWDEDPRTSGSACERMVVTTPQPRRRGLGPGYDAMLGALLAETDRRFDLI